MTRLALVLALVLPLVLLAGCIRINLWAGSLDDPYELSVPGEDAPAPTPTPGATKT